MRTLLFIILFAIHSVSAQVTDGVAGTTVNQKYDHSFISPELRAKHSFSLGFVNAQTTPNAENLEFSRSFHFGYNYLILNKRKLKLAIKDKSRTEARAIGLHFTRVQSGEYFLMGTFFNPFIALKGRLMSLYFLSEYGLGYLHRKNVDGISENSNHIHISIEALRFRFGRLPLYFHITGSYAITNKLFEKKPMELGYIAGFRYYFYSKK